MGAGSIISGGFGVVRRHPGAVALWGLLYLAATVAMALAMRPIMATFSRLEAAGAGDPAAGAAVTSAMSWLLLVELAVVAVAIILFAAAIRSVLQPERPGFAFLRAGMDELRLFGLAMLFFILLYVGLLVATLVVVLVVALAAVASGASAAIAVSVIAVVGLLGAVVWLQVRLSLAFPLTVMRGKIVIGEAWRLTRGRFWTLFIAYFAIFLLLLIFWIAAALAASGLYFADLASGGFTPENFQRAGERQLERQFGAPSPTMAAGWALSALAGSLTIALFGGAVATAARDAVTDVDALGETFA
ncbi:MAG TPA: hypothetical protein VFQ67_01930 [Allosphingosinicella sp.]|jgi:hypothetical protein|nr:hypothetical protein [Allosphingosinicella sp.]